MLVVSMLIGSFVVSSLHETATGWFAFVTVGIPMLSDEVCWCFDTSNFGHDGPSKVPDLSFDLRGHSSHVVWAVRA